MNTTHPPKQGSVLTVFLPGSLKTMLDQYLAQESRTLVTASQATRESLESFLSARLLPISPSIPENDSIA
jgi:hypothetical protein